MTVKVSGDSSMPSPARSKDAKLSLTPQRSRRVGGHVVLGDRLAGDPMPLFPFSGAAWRVVGAQELSLAESAAAVLLGEQYQDAAVEQGWVLPAPPGPVGGQCGVVRRRRAEDQTVPDDLGPAEPGSQAPLSRLPKIHRSRLAGLNPP